MLIGADPKGLSNIAALTDQSDGWARIRLDGAGAEAAMRTHLTRQREALRELAAQQKSRILA